MAVCPWFDKVPLYVDGRLDDEQAAEFEAHFDSCPQCQPELKRLTGDDPLESASSAGRPNEPPLEAEPFSHPDYIVLKELGCGSGGVVYLARDRTQGRLVAVKILHAGPQRVMAETTAVEILKHPHIVTLYETGQRHGRPFLVMEHAEGNSLAHFLEELRKKKRTENKAQEYVPWEPRHAAELLHPVADAVAAVHRRGILHRDLKPGNLLLCKAAGGGGDPLSDGPAAGWVPKVADFGLAKFLREDGPQGDTRIGDLLGTPSYISPEQAQGKKDLGPPTDVYSLGVILYRLLTGRTPFISVSYVNNLIAVVQEDPVPPTHFTPTIPRELSVICLKCLEKHPARRYAHAGALADDLGRFLAGQPITARPPGTVRQLARWGRRHPRLAAGAALVVLFALVGTPVFSALYIRAEAQRERAEHFATLSLDALEQPAIHIAEKAVLRKAGLLDQERDLLEAVAPLYELFLERARGDATALASKGNVYNKLAVVRRALGNPDGALDACREAEGVFRRLGPAHHLGLATALSHKAAVLGPLGRLQEAVTAVAEAEPILEELAASDPGRADVRFRLAACQNSRALCLRFLGDVPGACLAFDAAVKNLSLLIANPKDKLSPLMPTFCEWRIRILGNKGDTLLQAEKTTEAAAPLEEAASQAEFLVKDDPHSPSGRDAQAACLVNLANLRMAQERYREAEATLGLCRDVYASLNAQFPRAQEYRWGVSLATLGIAKAKLNPKDQENVAGGLEEVKKAIAGYDVLVNDYPKEVTIAKERGDAYAVLAQALLMQKKPAEAEAPAQTCLEIFQVLSQKHPGGEFAQMEADAKALLDSIRAAKRGP